MGDKIGSKQDRLLYIYTSLLNGEALQLSEIAEKYEVSEKSVSRDFELIELFLSDYNLEKGRNYENCIKKWKCFLPK